MSEEQQIIRPRTENNRWEDIERLFGSWADEVETYYFDDVDDRCEPDPELEDLISAFGH